jgi:prevent-host-death family protein
MHTEKISTMQSSQARINFRAIMTRVEEHGELITLTRYDRAAAVIVPADWYERAAAALAAQGAE